jgi:hypothetical protein
MGKPVMTAEEKARLLFGPYHAPRLKRGDRVMCLYRDRLVVVCRYSEARLPWPICRPAEPPLSGLGLLVDDELARAIQNESALALRYWWGVGRSTAQRWRGAFEVGRMDSEGSRIAILGAIQATIDARVPEEEADAYGLWSPDEEALLGVLTDREAANRTGRALNAVRGKRRQMGRKNPDPRSLPHPGRPWTLEEDGMVARLLPEEVARRTGRTLRAVYARRAQLREWLFRVGGQDRPGTAARPSMT